MSSRFGQRTAQNGVEGMNIWHNPIALRWISNWLALLAFLLFVSAAVLWLIRLPYFSIRAIELTAVPGQTLQFVDANTIPSIRLGPVSGGLFRADLNHIKQVVEAAPWVRRANIRRVWPNRLLVEIEEHRAVARWEDGRLLNSYHELFVANSGALENEQDLAILAGPQGSHAEVARRWLELDEWLKPLSRTVSQLTLSERYSWKVELDDGMTLILGRDQGAPQPARDRVIRMVQAFPDLTQSLRSVPVQIDLRHSDGFAIRLKNGAGLSPIDPNSKPVRPS